MSRRQFFLNTILIALFTLSIGFAADSTIVEDFTLKNYDGKEYTLSDYKDAKAIVIMFIATRCPVSNAYNERMVKLYDDYAEKGVVFLGINSNKQEDSEECKEHAEEKEDSSNNKYERSIPST